MATEQDYWNLMYYNARRQSLPSVMYKPKLFLDGNQWCALYGEDLQNGLAGFGNTPELAMEAFDKAWSKVAPGVMLVEDLELDTRTLNCLLAGGIVTVDQLVEQSANDLLRNLSLFGRKSLRDVVEKLEEHGLSLRAEESR